MPNLVSLTQTSIQILGKTQTEVFLISGFPVNLVKVNCHNSRNSDDINMKFGPVTKLDKRNKTISKKKLTMTPYRKTVTSLSFFQFMANLDQSGSRIPDAQPVEVIFSSTVTFYLTKTENRTKISLTLGTSVTWLSGT